MHVQAGITALSNAHMKDGIYLQQDLVAPVPDSCNIKKKKQNKTKQKTSKMDTCYFGNQESDLAYLNHLSASSSFFF